MHNAPCKTCDVPKHPKIAGVTSANNALWPKNSFFWITMKRISVYITFLLTHLSTWPSNWTIVLKYTEGVSRFVTALKRLFIYSFSSFRKTERTPVCFLFESTSWRWQTISFIIPPTVSCTSNKLNGFKKRTKQMHKKKQQQKVVMLFKRSIVSIKVTLSQYKLSHWNHASIEI